MKTYILAISILALALVYFTFFQEPAFEKSDTTNSLRDVTETEHFDTDSPYDMQENTQPRETNVDDNIYKQTQEEQYSDTRSTVNVNEKNNDSEIICPDDVFVCSSGNFGEPNSPTELRRVPPTCEFPACPG